MFEFLFAPNESVFVMGSDGLAIHVLGVGYAYDAYDITATGWKKADCYRLAVRLFQNLYKKYKWNVKDVGGTMGSET